MKVVRAVMVALWKIYHGMMLRNLSKDLTTGRKQADTDYRLRLNGNMQRVAAVRISFNVL